MEDALDPASDLRVAAAASADSAPAAPGPDRAIGERRFGAVNWLGVWTLYVREVRRFLKVAFQTVFAPVTSTLLFLLVFHLALGQNRGDVNGAPFIVFLAPGLAMMAILNNAFANSSSSLIIAKVQGSLVDILMPPLSAAELTAGLVLGAATRGLMVGVSTIAAMAIVMAWAGAPLSVHNIFAAFYFALAASTMLGMVGVIAGIWAEKFDQLAVVTNFVITPMAFLSGTFYSIRDLPETFYGVSQWNPIFYLIDGIRYGFTGVSDASVLRGALIAAALNVVLLAICYRLFKSGYKLRS
ncbi:MAG: ABC transporter permease [Pseudomonadota bacterium]